MLKLNFIPEPLLSCQKLYWMRERVVFTEGEGITFNWNWTGTKFKAFPGAVNGGCIDTSKSYVDEIFTKVYGYSSRAGKGLAVEKPDNTNGAKDCRLTTRRRKGCFYQKYLADSDTLTERRVIIMGGKVVYSILKIKQIGKNNLSGKVIRYEFDEDFRDERINEFCGLYPLDYGELDVITFEGKDYIIDVNPTPGDAAFVHMPPLQAEKYLKDYERKLREWLTSL